MLFKKFQLFLHLSCLVLYQVVAIRGQNTCSEEEKHCTTLLQSTSKYETQIESNIYKKSYLINGKNITYNTYIQPDVSTFYNEPIGSRSIKKSNFVGFAAKFINLSPFHIDVYWYPGAGRKGILFHQLTPFHSYGTASFPTHQFYLTYQGKPNEKLKWFTMDPTNSIYVFDAFEELNLAQVHNLPRNEWETYHAIRTSLEFGKQYKAYTGRDWLSWYPRPENSFQHFMWKADYFNQKHWIETRETHFMTMPPKHALTKIKDYGSARKLQDSQPRILNEYRDPSQSKLNLTLKVISCAPQAFEIENFLSETEIEHILDLTTQFDLQKSRTGSEGGALSSDDEVKVRTSRNSWVDRETSPIIDAIYRRAADVLQIDEALLRHRMKDDLISAPYYPTKSTIAEHLQLVHYNVGQEYTAHHDFAYPFINDGHHSTRFATLLLYLNEGMIGGETSFPRWVNAETGKELMTTPKKGKAVLFYSYLPDGNLDDFSQHAAKPVRQGEKWLMNLWIWDQFFPR